jgi:hypothetical protein
MRDALVHSPFLIGVVLLHLLDQRISLLAHLVQPPPWHQPFGEQREDDQQRQRESGDALEAVKELSHGSRGHQLGPFVIHDGFWLTKWGVLTARTVAHELARRHLCRASSLALSDDHLLAQQQNLDVLGADDLHETFGFDGLVHVAEYPSTS